MDNVVITAKILNTPVAQVATLLGHSFVHPNAPGAHRATVVVDPNILCAQRALFVGQLVVNPNALSVEGTLVMDKQAVNHNMSIAQGASVVDQLTVNHNMPDQHALNRNMLCAQVATVLGQQAVNPISCAQAATTVGQHAVNPDVVGAQRAMVMGESSAQGAMIVGQYNVNPNAPGAQRAMFVGKHVVNPHVSGAQGATIMSQHDSNPVVLGAQQAMVVGEPAINPNLLGAHGVMVVGQQPPHMAYDPLIYPVVPTDHAEKPEKFDGSNFTCWQQKMKFYLTTLNLSRFLEEEGPMDTIESNTQTRMTVDEWNRFDYLCRNYVLNCLVDSLYDMYSSKRTTKELWESLDHMYGTKCTKYMGAKLYIVGQFLDYKMVDSKAVTNQVEDLHAIIHEIHAQGMVISESFQVAAIIEKLPSGWHEFKNRLRHKQKEMSMGELILRLRIEEDNRRYGKKFNVAKDDIVKGHNTKLKKNNNGKESNNVAKGSRMGPKGQISKTQKFYRKFYGKCFICEKKGHKSSDCRVTKKMR